MEREQTNARTQARGPGRRARVEKMSNGGGTSGRLISRADASASARASPHALARVILCEFARCTVCFNDFSFRSGTHSGFAACSVVPFFFRSFALPLGPSSICRIPAKIGER